LKITHKKPKFSKYYNVSWCVSSKCWIARKKKKGKLLIERKFENELLAALHVDWACEDAGLVAPNNLQVCVAATTRLGCKSKGEEQWLKCSQCEMWWHAKCSHLDDDVIIRVFGSDKDDSLIKSYVCNICKPGKTWNDIGKSAESNGSDSEDDMEVVDQLENVDRSSEFELKEEDEVLQEERENMEPVPGRVEVSVDPDAPMDVEGEETEPEDVVENKADMAESSPPVLEQKVAEPGSLQNPLSLEELVEPMLELEKEDEQNDLPENMIEDAKPAEIPLQENHKNADLPENQEEEPAEVALQENQQNADLSENQEEKIELQENQQDADLPENQEGEPAILAILDGFWNIDDGTTIEISENKIIWETDKVVIINDLGNSRFSTDSKICNLEASFTEDVIRWADGDVWNRVKENYDNFQESKDPKNWDVPNVLKWCRNPEFEIEESSIQKLEEERIKGKHLLAMEKSDLAIFFPLRDQILIWDELKKLKRILQEEAEA